MDFFRNIESYPKSFTASNIIVRMIDGLGFRFYWTTHGLRKKDYEFSPAEGRWSISETVRHIRDLVNWISISFEGKNWPKPENDKKIREDTLKIMQQLRNLFENSSNEDLDNYRIRGMKVWNIINGPLADALEHTGQIEMLRRINGNPPENFNYFLGKPPKE
ncbi:MAG: hypothetical protein ABF289_19275 [Clostridiales bacterium]